MLSRLGRAVSYTRAMRVLGPQPARSAQLPAHFGRPRLPRLLFLGAIVLLVSGCGSVALKRSFDNYSNTYAETQNQQMLENLARLSNREPIYFFQLAQISAGYTFTETAGVGDTHERGLTNTASTPA